MTPAELVKTVHAEPPMYLLVVSEPDRLTANEIARRLRNPYPVHALTLSQEPFVSMKTHTPKPGTDKEIRDELRSVLAGLAAEHPAHRVWVIPARAVVA